MAKYRVLEQSFIDNKIVEAGTEIEYDGFPGPNLRALDSDARAAEEQVPADEVILKRQEEAANGNTNLPVLKPKKK